MRVVIRVHNAFVLVAPNDQIEKGRKLLVADVILLRHAVLIAILMNHGDVKPVALIAGDCRR
jgi:hypothetical protein